MKKLGYLVLVLSVALLTGCKPSDDQMLRVGKDALSQALKDPSSAQFRSMHFVPDPNQSDSVASGFVCGELNGKNSFGAYVGFKRVYIHVEGEPRWVIPLLGVVYSSSEPFTVDEGDQMQTTLDKLKMYAARCEK
ncbi:hypothetical protein [Pantoea allii]|uniref:hypothetical protein n=1 Tax=Pantoea allii TaxID=574096 RepID=UPI0024B66DB7|nr:hypothetical protein [Pantoea allii]MDJ0087717.1 hypothetical protein [Pantoea allii]